MYITCTKSTANLKPIDNLVVSPDTSTASGELCWLTEVQNQEADPLQQPLIACYQRRNGQCRMSPDEF